MIQILLHSSKTMRVPQEYVEPLGRPQLEDAAAELVGRMRKVSVDDIADMMAVSHAKAVEVEKLYKQWSSQKGVAAIDLFVGDIYSGLRAQEWTQADRAYAHEHLLILSGLYGAVRACDGIMPYRLEMGYKLPGGESLYRYWGKRIAGVLPASIDLVVNLSAVEYTKALLPYTDAPVVTPRFLTVSPKTGVPTFVTVHAKIARGAFARWLIQERVNDTQSLSAFADLGYVFDAAQSTPSEPVFVCREFGGLGLSVRKT